MPSSLTPAAYVRSLVHDRQRCATVGGVADAFPALSRAQASALLQSLLVDDKHDDDASNDDASNNSNSNNSNNEPTYQVTVCRAHEEPVEMTTDDDDADAAIPCTGTYVRARVLLFPYTAPASVLPLVVYLTPPLILLILCIIPPVALCLGLPWPFFAGDTTVFTLGTAAAGRHKVPAEGGVLFAVTLAKGGESFGTAAERQMAAQRDATTLAPPAGAAALIAPATQVQALLEAAASGTEAPTTTTVVRAPPPGQTTTAAAFFQKSKKTARTGTTTASSAGQEKAAAPKAVAKANNPFAKAVGASNRSKATAHQDEKENCLQAKAAVAATALPTVGNADDFQGDRDDGDDVDDEEVATPPAVVRAHVPYTVGEEDPMVVDVDDQATKAKPTIYGAMDDFCQAKATPEAASHSSGEPPRRRKRRKVWKKRLTQDARGYMHEEMQEVWEELPSDEEEDAAAQTKRVVPPPLQPPKKVMKAAGMKQGSLMGFFKKK
jgi:hypothetical protein